MKKLIVISCLLLVMGITIVNAVMDDYYFHYVRPYKCYPNLTHEWDGNCERSFDYVDIGNETSESTHNLIDWGPIEPQTHGGSYGGIDDSRAVSTIDGTDKATADLIVGKYSNSIIRIKALDGFADDSFKVYANNVLVYKYVNSGNTEETWKDHIFYLYTPEHRKADIKPTHVSAGKNKITLRIVATGQHWSGYSTYGQLAIDEIEVISGFIKTYSPTYIVI